VLSDPKRRKIYDELGELGLKLQEGKLNEINPTTLLRNFQVRNLFH
jgi:DnaJ-class molecular chaperone